MSNPPILNPDSLARATHWLASVDPDLGAIVARLGIPPLWGRTPGFPTLVHIVLEQQVSLAAARTVFEKLTSRLGEMTPEAVVSAGPHGLRDFGLTRQKASTCHDLAQRCLDGRLDLESLDRVPEPDGRRALLDVHGIGPWTTDIYFLMALRTADVWPTGDLALASALRDVKRLDALPTRDEQIEMARPWAPWRSVAARLLWAHYLDARGKYSVGP